MVVALQIIDGRNDDDNNRYGLRNREHSNRDDVYSINKQRSNNEEKDKEEEEEVVRPQQRHRVDERKQQRSWRNAGRAKRDRF